MDNYLEINGKYYAIDMDKVMEFIGADTNSVVQAINQTYGIVEDSDSKSVGDIQLVQKEVTETKENMNSVLSGYRYNLMQNMLMLIMNPISDFSDNTVAILHDFEAYGIGQRMAFNTLLGMGIIYEIETDE